MTVIYAIDHSIFCVFFKYIIDYFFISLSEKGKNNHNVTFI